MKIARIQSIKLRRDSTRARLIDAVEENLHLVGGGRAEANVEASEDFFQLSDDVVNGHGDAGDFNLEALTKRVLCAVEVDGQTRLALASRPDERFAAVSVVPDKDKRREVVLGRNARARFCFLRS